MTVPAIDNALFHGQWLSTEEEVSYFDERARGVEQGRVYFNNPWRDGGCHADGGGCTPYGTGEVDLNGDRKIDVFTCFQSAEKIGADKYGLSEYQPKTYCKLNTKLEELSFAAKDEFVVRVADQNALYVSYGDFDRDGDVDLAFRYHLKEDNSAGGIAVFWNRTKP